MINFYKTLIKSSYKIELLKNEKKDLNFIKNKNNNSKVDVIERCPYCKSEEIIKYGSYRGKQRYKCKNDLCEKTFTNEIYNEFRYSKKFKENYQKYFVLLNKGVTLRECAKELNITLVTAFFWRHRFLADLENKYYIEKITSHVELTKMVMLENFKGSRIVPEDCERAKITVITALNDEKEMIPIMAARNFFGFYEIRDNIIPRLNKKAYVVGLVDGKLKNFAKAFNELHKNKFEKHYLNNIDKRYSLKTKKWLSKFRGVASKYLDHYLYWRTFEYRNNPDFKENEIISEDNKVQSDLIYKIKLYISWKNIKLKKLII